MAEYSKRDFIINMLIMSTTMLVLRIITMGFNIYFTSVIGAEKTGLFHIVFSVYGFLITFSISGTGLAVTRLVAECGKNFKKRETDILKKSIILCLATSGTAMLFTIIFSARISIFTTGSTEISPALCLLASSLIPLSVSAILRGYFMAVRKSVFVTLSQLTEEISSIVITMSFLAKIKNTPYGYMSMICGISFSAYIAFLLDFIIYRLYSKNLRSGDKNTVYYKEILSISAPVAMGSYLRSALLCSENVLIPRCLGARGDENALARYGVIKGMSLPIMLFPTLFISAFSSLLLPEMANRFSKGHKNGIRHMAKKAIFFTILFSAGVAVILFLFHDKIGNVFYNNNQAGIYLGYLAFLVVPMYIDTVVDSILKGLNEQVMSLWYNIIDSVLRVIMIVTLIPRYGAIAYIAILYISEIFNLSLSLSRLIRVTCKNSKKIEQKSGKRKNLVV